MLAQVCVCVCGCVSIELNKRGESNPTLDHVFDPQGKVYLSLKDKWSYFKEIW